LHRADLLPLDGEEMTSVNHRIIHHPVLYQEIIHALQPERGGFFVDCTLGTGGHAWGILKLSSPDGRLLGMDLDAQAISIARERLVSFGTRATLIHTSFVTLIEQLHKLNWNSVDGILLDLGVSSFQLDTPKRGFSFLQDAPLDMRFDLSSHVKASDLVNVLSEEELTSILSRYGEERYAHKISREIVQNRPLNTTFELTEMIEKAVKNTRVKERRIHPATRTFQALRIAVNRELENLEKILPQAVTSLSPSGRLAVISFHSLEDRIVKQFLRRESTDCLCPPRQPVCTCQHQAVLLEITRRPIRPQSSEIEQNSRARSARLRIAEKKK